MYVTYIGSAVDPNPDPGGQKWPIKIEKDNKFHLCSAGCSLLRAEGFSCSLDVLYGGLAISSKLQILFKKETKKFSTVFFSSIFGHQNPGSRSISGSGFTWNAGSGSGFNPQHCMALKRERCPSQLQIPSAWTQTHSIMYRHFHDLIQGKQKLKLNANELYAKVNNPGRTLPAPYSRSRRER